MFQFTPLSAQIWPKLVFEVIVFEPEDGMWSGGRGITSYDLIFTRQAKVMDDDVVDDIGTIVLPMLDRFMANLRAKTTDAEILAMEREVDEAVKNITVKDLGKHLVSIRDDLRHLEKSMTYAWMRAALCLDSDSVQIVLPHITYTLVPPEGPTASSQYDR